MLNTVLLASSGKLSNSSKTAIRLEVLGLTLVSYESALRVVGVAPRVGGTNCFIINFL